MTLVTAGQLSSLKQYRDLDQHSLSRANKHTITVNSVNLNVVLKRVFPERNIDFLSIDVEGPELDIIRGFDFINLCQGTDH